MTDYIKTVGIIVAIIHLSGIICTLNALLYARSSQSAIAWSLSLIFFPYLAIPLYLIFGRIRFRGYLELKKELKSTFSKVADEIHELYNDPNLVNNSNQSLKTFEQLAERGWTTGNSVTLLQSGEATFKEIFKAINEAKYYVLLQFYTIEDDNLGQEVKNVLVNAAKRGIKCYVLYDEIGSSNLSNNFIENLLDAGVEVNSFNTTLGFFNSLQLNFRNHRKIVVTDGATAIVGGNNIGEDYLGKNPLFGDWRDLQILIKGPESLFIQKIFVLDWYWSTRTVPELIWEAFPRENGCSLLTLSTGPLGDKASCTLLFLNAINSAKERLWISTPYFIPDTPLIEALKLASLRGIDVRLLIPNKVDNLLAWLASFYCIEMLNPFPIKIYRFYDGFLHEKCFLVDNLYCSVGSANLDNRSCNLNFEVSVLCSDITICKQLETRFLAGFAKSHDVSDIRLDSHPFFKRLGIYIARLFSPLL
jgi:cardiolipin synthase A/B